MKYKSLARIFYADASNERYERNRSLAAARLEAESTFRTGVDTEHGELFLAVPRELSILNETILRRERLIAVTLSGLPRIAAGALVRSLVVDEVVCSNDLEGVYSTRRQINELLEATSSDSSLLEHRRFRELARLYLELSDDTRTLPQSPEDIRSLYDRVMAGENLEGNAPDGALFRKDAVSVIGSGNKVVHTGLTPESRIVSAMAKMIALVSSPEIPETYSAVISHFLFEYAHPFYDGNGRTGRYLLALYLSGPLSTLTALSISRSIAENRGPYYRAFRDVEHPLNHGELTTFVIKMLEYVDVAQQRILSDLETKRARLEAVNETLQRLQNTYGLADKHCDVLFMLAQFALFGAFPDVPLGAIEAFLGLGRAMTRKYARALEEQGLIRAVSARPLRFALTGEARQQLEIPEE